MLIYIYDENGSPIGVKHRNKVFVAEQIETYLFGKNLQGDIIAIYNTSGTAIVKYVYDAWGNIISTSGTQATGIGAKNSLRYRGYYYDTETGLYYLRARYYDPVTGRFISADNRLSTGGDLSGMNLYAYCGNNPVNRIDPTGEAWWHWAIGAALVAACAVAVVVTAGGAAAGFAAVTMVANGCAAFSASSTIAAGAFIGSSMAYTAAVIDASAESESLEDFAEKGNWGTVISTAISGAIGGYIGYETSKTQVHQIVTDDETFLPDSFYSKHAPKQGTPNSSYTNYTYNNYTGKYEKSTVYYDFAGRQNIRIDWTNHGYSNHGNPHIHYTNYDAQHPNGFTIRWD